MTALIAVISAMAGVLASMWSYEAAMNDHLVLSALEAVGAVIFFGITYVVLRTWYLEHRTKD